MTIDLVLCTIGRVDELDLFLESIRGQSQDVRVLLVDQNADDRLAGLVGKHSDAIEIVWLRSEKGLSRARNVGLAHLKADIVMFPDDDCVYPDGLLRKVREGFASREVSLMTFRAQSPEGDPVGPRWLGRSGYFSRDEVWNVAISYTIAVSRSLLDMGVRFDESLGVGSGTDFGSGEETDFVLQCLELGAKAYFEKTLYAIHPKFKLDDESKYAARKVSYARGAGFVAGKHGFGRTSCLEMSLRPLLARLVGKGHCARLSFRKTVEVAQGYRSGFAAGSQSRAS